MVLDDLVDSFCYSLENAGLKGLIDLCHVKPEMLIYV